MGSIVGKIKKDISLLRIENEEYEKDKLKDLEKVKGKELMKPFYFSNEFIVLDVRPLSSLIEELDGKSFMDENHVSGIVLETVKKGARGIGYMNYRDYENNSKYINLGCKVNIIGKVKEVRKYKGKDLVLFQIREIN